MRTIVKDADREVSLSDLRQEHDLYIVVYKRKSNRSSGNYALLTRIARDQYGFVAINGSSTSPTYVGCSALDCIEKALDAGREPLQFRTLSEFTDHANRTGGC